MNICFLSIVVLFLFVRLRAIIRLRTCFDIQSEKLSSLTGNLVENKENKGSE